MKPQSENDLQRLNRELNEIKKKMLKQGSPQELLYDNADMIKIMKVTGRTLANWRKKGILKFKKIGGKIYYTHDDVQEILRRIENT